MHKEPKIIPIITKAYIHRIEFVKSLFKEIGYMGQELESRTRLFVGYFSLDAIMMNESSKKKRIKKAMDMLDFITSV